MERLSQSPADPSFVQDPYPFYARARAAGDLIHWTDYGMACATSYAAVDAVLKDRRMGRAEIVRPDIPPHLTPFYAVEAHSMLDLEPPRHTRLRGLVLRAFTSRRIAALGPEIGVLCRELIDAMPEDEVDLLPTYAQRLPVIVIARLLGVPEDMADQLLAWSNAMVAMYQARKDRAIEDAAATAAQDFADFLRGYIETRRSAPADDLLTHLIAAEEDGARLSTDELIGTAILLLNAGHEATVHTMGNGIRAILQAGGPQDWMSEARIDATVEEVLRFDPPLHMFTRIVYEPLEIFGETFRRGDKIACLLGSANRDAARFDAPDRFDPSRDLHKHTAFGVGIHFCVGAPLARLELRIGLQTLFDRMPKLHLAEEPQFADTYHFHGLKRLMVAR